MASNWGLGSHALSRALAFSFQGFPTDERYQDPDIRLPGMASGKAPDLITRDAIRHDKGQTENDNSGTTERGAVRVTRRNFKCGMYEVYTRDENRSEGGHMWL